MPISPPAWRRAPARWQAKGCAGGRKGAIRRPRVRTEGREVTLPTFRTLANTDPLNRRVVEQMLVGVATRQYARSLGPLPAETKSRGTSKSRVRRRVGGRTA